MTAAQLKTNRYPLVEGPPLTRKKRTQRKSVDGLVKGFEVKSEDKYLMLPEGLLYLLYKADARVDNHRGPQAFMPPDKDPARVALLDKFEARYREEVKVMEKIRAAWQCPKGPPGEAQKEAIVIDSDSSISELSALEPDREDGGAGEAEDTKPSSAPVGTPEGKKGGSMSAEAMQTPTTRGTVRKRSTTSGQKGSQLKKRKGSTPKPPPKNAPKPPPLVAGGEGGDDDGDDDDESYASE